MDIGKQILYETKLAQTDEQLNFYKELEYLINNVKQVLSDLGLLSD